MKKHKIEIKPSQIDLGKEINKIGTYESQINLHAEVIAKIHIEVVKQEEKKIIFYPFFHRKKILVYNFLVFYYLFSI